MIQADLLPGFPGVTAKAERLKICGIKRQIRPISHRLDMIDFKAGLCAALDALPVVPAQDTLPDSLPSAVFADLLGIALPFGFRVHFTPTLVL
jgi:hypothetical protein